MSARHFLTLTDFDRDTFERVLARAVELKRMTRQGLLYEPLRGRTLAMIFELPSTRTRVAFETGMTQLGGHALFLSPQDTQLGRGEPVADTARVLASMVDAVMIRAPDHAKIIAFAEASTVPVINAMSTAEHPCQVLADLQTYRERHGGIGGRRVAFVGDGHNMCQSYVIASHVFGFDLEVACPEGFEPDPGYLERFGARTRVGHDPQDAVRDAHLVVTDVWSSMGQEGERAARVASFDGFRVDARLLDRARDDVLFLHCLPAHRGEEVSEDVLDDPRSGAWEAAENRLHSQKALLELLLLGPR